MIDEEGLITDIGTGFERNASVMKQTMGKIDKLMTSASSSVMCYLILFVFMVMALLYKLGRWNLSNWDLNLTVNNITKIAKGQQKENESLPVTCQF